MNLDPRSCYRAVRSRDFRYDGRFFTGVKTTGIYCRPVCPARLPLYRNVTFYRTAAEAEESGFRPCKRCRPETAAGSPSWNGTSTTVSRALRLIDDGFLMEHDVDQLAGRLGLGERHLRSLFAEHVGVSPKALANAKRLDFARTLIDTTKMPITEVAYAAGFASIRRFNDAFRSRYEQTPRAIRNAAAVKRGPRPARGLEAGAAAERDVGVAPGGFVTRLAYRPPLDWTWMLRYLGGHALPGVEIVDAERYARSFRVAGTTGWLRATPEPARHRVRVEVFMEGARPLMRVVQKIRKLFDLGADPLAISEALSVESTLARLIERFPGTRMPGSWDAWETAVTTIVGQSISVKAAASVAGVLVEKYGEPAAFHGHGAPTRLFPRPDVLARARLTSAGLTRGKARAIRLLSRALLDGQLDLDGVVDFAALRGTLQQIPGIGPWTADYITLKLGDPDAFPATDLVLARCLEELETDGAAWAPWRGYASHVLWRWHGEDRQA